MSSFIIDTLSPYFADIGKVAIFVLFTCMTFGMVKSALKGDLRL